VKFVSACLCLLQDFEQDGEESECDPDILNDPINQIDLQVRIICLLHFALTVVEIL